MIDAGRKDGLQSALMKLRAVAVVALWLSAGAAFAANPMMGTWKLNEAKSKLDPATGKNATVVYAKEGTKVKVTVDGVDAKGKPTHNEWVGKFDGKDYPTTGDPSNDTRSYTKVNNRTLDMTVKKNGKVVGTGRIEVATDGKTRTVTVNGMTPKGKKYHNVAVYDKQ